MEYKRLFDKLAEESEEFKNERKYSESRINLGSLMASVRKERGLTQPDLADKAGVSLGTLVNLEKGYHNVNLKILFKIALALDCELEIKLVNKEA